MRADSESLGTEGKRSGPLSQREVSQVLERHRSSGESLGRCLVALGWPNERTGLEALAEALQIRFVDLEEARIDPAATSLVPAELLQRARVMPVRVFSRLCVAGLPSVTMTSGEMTCNCLTR